MKHILSAIVLLSVLMLGTHGTSVQGPGDRYDQQICSNIARVLAGNPQFSGITVQVEEGVVTLGGSVETEVLRRDLVVRVSHIAYVTEVVDQIVISSPSPPGRVP